MSGTTVCRDLHAVLDHIQRFAGVRVWVVGDLMLDEYALGTVDRISPEAPVPVVRVCGIEYRLGGAANVARQAAALGAQVSLAGAIGMDAAGEQLLDLCRTAGIDVRPVARLADRATTRKLRVMGQSQQLLRLDWEDARPCAAHAMTRALEQLEQTPPPDAVILSDYAKGVLTPETIAAVMALRSAAPVLVDPKHRDFSRYRGATAIKPNLRELELAAGAALDPDDTEAIASAARRLARTAGLEAIVVTLGGHGMLVVPTEGPATPVPAVKREVYDVTGAGDTAIAVLAVALATGAPLFTAAEIANTASGLAVGEVGGVAVDPARIRDALARRPDGKVLPRDALAARAATWRMAGKRIVLTNGCFDLLHSGHLSLLESASKLGEVLVLAINSDASVRRLKGPERPLVPQAERAALLAALSFVDAVTIFDEDTPLATLEAVRPHVLVKGADYRPDQIVGRELVEGYGGRVAAVPLVPHKSTSALVERIRAGRAA